MIWWNGLQEYTKPCALRVPGSLKFLSARVPWVAKCLNPLEAQMPWVPYRSPNAFRIPKWGNILYVFYLYKQWYWDGIGLMELNAWKVSKYGAFSGSYFPVFELNTEKYRPEKTPYLDTFYSVVGAIYLSFQSLKVLNFTCINFCQW